MACRMVVVSGPGVAGVDGGDLGCCRRSSGADENGATVHGRINGQQLRVLQAPTKPTGICTGPIGHRSLVGDELMRRRASGVMENGATASARPRG